MQNVSMLHHKSVIPTLKDFLVTRGKSCINHLDNSHMCPIYSDTANKYRNTSATSAQMADLPHCKTRLNVSSEWITQHQAFSPVPPRLQPLPLLATRCVVFSQKEEMTRKKRKRLGREHQTAVIDTQETKPVTPRPPSPPIHPLSMKADDSKGLVVVVFSWAASQINPDVEPL